jgi:hypothetical protein
MTKRATDRKVLRRPLAQPLQVGAQPDRLSVGVRRRLLQWCSASARPTNVRVATGALNTAAPPSGRGTRSLLAPPPPAPGNSGASAGLARPSITPARSFARDALSDSSTTST